MRPNKNAAHEGQVKEQEGKAERLREQELSDVRLMLSTREGRRLLWRLLAHCQVFASIHHASGSQVYYNSGRQDVGHFLMSEIVEAREQALIEMMQENKGDN